VKPGIFITFEGPEGSGKSTQAKRLVAQLERESIPTVATFEPGGTPLALRVRSILTEQRESEAGSVDERTELLLMLAARAHHVRNLIQPALAGGKVVVCDRFSDSTRAYQGAGRGLDMSTINRLNDYATGGLEPRLTFFLDVDADLGLERVRQTNRKLDRFEQEAVDFHRRVVDCYRGLASSAPDRFISIAGTRPADEIAEHIYGVFRRTFPEVFRGSRSADL
jgi:dTMP kinase